MVAQRLQIEQAKVELQEKLLRATINTQEKERKRIATDLHDDIGSLLSALKLNVKHLKTVDKIGDTERQFLGATADMLDEGLKSVRDISYNLLPPTLVRFGLSEALHELVNRIKQSEQLAVTSDFSVIDSCEFEKTKELSIFRVLQELTSNTIHHSGATEITINCRKSDHLEIKYTDNGSGISDVSQLEGLGMINMQSRIGSIKGTLEIPNHETSSFHAIIRIPLT